MTESRANRYYFVPLGREKGGYLELLELPPTVSLGEAKNAERLYKKGLEKEFRRKRKSLRESLSKKEITQEEFDERVKKWEDKKTQKNVELNKLNQTFQNAQAEKRKLAHMGLRMDEVIWHEIHFENGKEEFIRHLTSISRPLATEDPERLEKFRYRIAKDGFLTASDSTQKEIAAATASNSLDNFLGRINALKLMALIWADNIWSNLATPTREFWTTQLATWIGSLPFYPLEPIPDSRPSTQMPGTDSAEMEKRNVSRYPLLCSPTRFSVNRLEQQEVEEVIARPKRRGDQKAVSLRDLLKAYLEKELTETSEKSAESRHGKAFKAVTEEVLVDLFMDLMKSTINKKDSD